MGGSHDVLGVAPIHRLNKLDASPAFIIEKNREPGHWGCRVAGLFLAAGTKQNLVERHLLPAEAPVADAQSPSRREWVEQGRMCSLFSAELESQSGSERVEARSAQTPEFRLFESACFPDYPSSDLSQAPLIQVMHCMHHYAK